MIGLIVFIAVMGFTLGRTRLTWPERFLNDTFGAVQGVLYRPAAAVRDFFGDVGRLSSVYKENEQLRQTVARYAQDQIRYNRIEEDNKRLKEELGFTERQKHLYDYRYLIAQVVAASSNPYDRSFKIDLGARDGVKANMAVTTVDGLIGIVSHTSEFTSTVTPITELDALTNKGISVAATVLGKIESFGIIEYDKEKGLQMTKIAENDKLAVGDTVITSGLGNLFPEGIPVGKVVSRQVGDFGLTHTALIDPAADFDHPREVFVVAAPDVDGP